MANEFKHKDVGAILARSEWEGIDTHEADSQAAGDIIYCDGTYWKRLAKGTTGLYLKCSTAPYWEAILDADIPATIARDTEVATAVSDHAALTATHGVAGTIASIANIATHAALTTGVHSFDESCCVYDDADQVIGNASFTVVAFPHEFWDTNTIHDTVTNNSRLTCKVAGKYFIYCTLRWYPSTAGRRQGRITNQAGTLLAYNEVAVNATSGDATFAAVCLAELAVGNYVEVYVYQSSGGNLNIDGAANEGALVSFGMFRIS